MTDLIYIANESEVLRYALRSIEKHAKNLGKVYLVGDAPKWLQGVDVIYCPNEYNRKAKNITNRLMNGLQHITTERFVMSADDIFLRRKIDLDKVGVYHKNGKTIGVPADMQNTRIAHILNEAREWLVAHGYTEQDFGGGHCLHACDYSVYKNDCLPLMQEMMQTTYGVPADLILGCCMERNGHKVRQRTDVKIDQWVDLDDFKAQMVDKDYFSIGGEDDRVIEILRQLYPKKSKYERD